jgi:hypothetical protein
LTLLLAHKGTLTTSKITATLNIKYHTAHRIMAELKGAGLVDIKEPETETEEKIMTLKEEFDWFLSDKFKELRQGFIPTDNTEEIKEYSSMDKEQEDTTLEEKNPLITYDYNCYECARINHGTPIYQTNSLSDYQKHWTTSGHKGQCQPGISDIEKHGWERQGKEWEI